MARPFIRIGVPIYNGVSPCSTFARRKLTTATTNIPRTQEKSPRASTHLHIDAICHQTSYCAVQATRTAWRRDGPITLTAPTAAHRGGPEWACGTDTTLVQSPEHSPGVRCRDLGHVTLVVRMRQLPAPGAWQGGAGIQWKGTIRITARHFRSLPHPSPRAYKKRIVKPAPLSLSSLSPACLALSPPVCHAHFSTSLLRPLFTALRCLPVAASALGVGVRQMFF